jgi:single-strand DNA-binding protein
MFDPMVTLVGNVLTAPEWRRTANTGTYVVTFRFASTSRRLDKATGHWVDGDSLRVKVACWRRLGENVSESVQLGDPLVIHGRLYSRDWVDAEERRHTSYELDAVAVGHDLARGVAKFARRRAVGPTESVDDPANATALGGEVTQRVESPGRPADLPADTELFTPFDDRFDTVPVPPRGHTSSATEEMEDLDGDDDEIDADVEEDEEVAVAA